MKARWIAWSWLCLAACSGAAEPPSDAGDSRLGQPDAAAPDTATEPPDAAVQQDEQLLLTAPASVAPELSFTVVVHSANRTSATVGLCSAGAGTRLAEARLYRGGGSASLQLSAAGLVNIEVCTPGFAGSRILRVEERPARELSGELTDSDLLWDATQDVHVSGDLIVPQGATLHVAPGTRVLLASKAAIIVRGELSVDGTQAQPVVFAAAVQADRTRVPWGGLRFEPASKGTLRAAFFTGGGGDSARSFGHSQSQPVIWADTADLTLLACSIADNPGKALGALNAHILVQDTLISRCDTGGQLNRTVLRLHDSFVLEIPDADGKPDDDDNDGLYLSQVYMNASGEPVESLIADSVFAMGEDDAIDHNDALVRIERTFIQDFHHEGLAASNGHRATIVDSVVRGCDRGIEAGYGQPEVVVERCLLTDNEYGLHVGDSYDWATSGHMQVSNSVSVGNRSGNLRNYVIERMGPLDGALDVRCSMVDDPAFDGASGNVSLVPNIVEQVLACEAQGSWLDSAACDDTHLGPAFCF